MTASTVEQSLVRLGRWLQGSDYRFVTVTPATHARVDVRSGARQARDLRDVFGWSRPFEPGLLPQEVTGWLQAGGFWHNRSEHQRSRKGSVI